jgi:hypothetical protein
LPNRTEISRTHVNIHFIRTTLVTDGRIRIFEYSNIIRINCIRMTPLAGGGLPAAGLLDCSAARHRARLGRSRGARLGRPGANTSGSTCLSTSISLSTSTSLSNCTSLSTSLRPATSTPLPSPCQPALGISLSASFLSSHQVEERGK